MYSQATQPKKNKLLLGVNIDHIASLRQARFTAYPNLLEAAFLVEEAGADAITIHLREDRRHIQDDDVYQLRKQIHNRMNLELAATKEMQRIALNVRPDDVCVVPERREELTTEGGLKVAGNEHAIEAFCRPLVDDGINVSIFIEPDEAQIALVSALGANVIELHTGRYANLTGDDRAIELERIQNAAQFAAKQGLLVNAGHGLDYQNTAEICHVPHLNELNIGHSIVSRAVFTGISKAVKQMLGIMNPA